VNVLRLVWLSLLGTRERRLTLRLTDAGPMVS
jgi:hypothetical protein